MAGQTLGAARTHRARRELPTGQLEFILLALREVLESKPTLIDQLDLRRQCGLRISRSHRDWTNDHASVDLVGYLRGQVGFAVEHAAPGKIERDA